MCAMHAKLWKSRVRCSHVVVLISLLGVFGCSGASTRVENVQYSGEAVADFVAALQVGDTKTLTGLLDSDASLLELKDELGQTPMHYAALNNQPEVIKLLNDRGLDVNVRDDEGRTPLTVLEDSGLRYEDARETLVDLGGTG